MTDPQSSRQLVLDRLGSPLAQLPGVFYRHRSPDLSRIYGRYGEYVDEAVLDARPVRGLEKFVAYLEGERERDYEAFHFGRELLLAKLYVPVEYPSADPKHTSAPAPAPRIRSFPSWSRRRPTPTKPKQLRALVLEQLGRPRPRLPGEYLVLASNAALAEVTAYFDQFDYKAITPPLVHDAIQRLIPMRERDWQAFCHGRATLLGLLPIEVEVPRPTCEVRASA